MTIGLTRAPFLTALILMLITMAYKEIKVSTADG